MSILTRIAALGALATGVVVVASCDTRVPTTTFVTTGTSTGGSSGVSTSTGGPNNLTVAIDSPLVGTLINVGDSVLVTVGLHDNKAVKSATITGVTEKGSVDLGTFQQTQRYKTVGIPLAGSFRSGLTDTTVRRYLQPLNPADTTLDSLIVIVVATDSAGLADTAHVRVNLVAGPNVSVVAPTNGDSVPAGVGLSVAARATDGNGVGRIDIRVRGEATWPTKLDTTLTQLYSNAPRDITFSSAARIPIDAPLRGKITITATSVDVNRNPGSSAPVVAFVRSAAAAIPRVTQSVLPRSEFIDSVSVQATGQGITTVGLIIRDTTGTVIKTDTVKLPAPYNANVQQHVGLNLSPAQQGQRLGITAFAIDQNGRVGYAVPLNQAAAEGNIANAVIDSTLLVYGRTYTLPHQGSVGDIAVDPTRGNVFLSNTANNLLDIWQSSATGKGFASTSVPVGSAPWGMFVSNNPDTLLVANSGGTNISRVFIGSTTASQLHEDLPNRILTRASYVFVVTENRDQATGKIRLTAQGPISYSDRPQYIAQSKGGRIYYSTRPTAAAPAGTLRWLDPTLPVPDPQQIWQYGTLLQTTQQIYVLFNADSIAIGFADPATTASDTLYLFDHPYGQATGVIAVKDPVPTAAVSKAVAAGSDAYLVAGLDVTTLGLTDTTFVAASGNRNWIAFGEGNKPGVGRIVMAADSTGPMPNFFSPLVTIADLTNNASEQVFGLALDLTGTTVAAHGAQSYFAFVASPFHLRLQGNYQSLSNGAGIVFHPQANGTLTPQAQRLAFVASTTGQIEMVDVAYYINRGTLQLKSSIYGPLRASLPLPGDDPSVVLKLYALSPQGFVVIDLTQNDIKPGP